jgi:hypothetical protein
MTINGKVCSKSSQQNLSIATERLRLFLTRSLSRLPFIIRYIGTTFFAAKENKPSILL